MRIMHITKNYAIYAYYKHGDTPRLSGVFSCTNLMGLPVTQSLARVMDADSGMV